MVENPNECRYCKRQFADGELRRVVGATLPQAPIQFHACEPQTAECKSAQREHYAAFDAMDANCNTCRSLVRVPHAKRAGGILYGQCAQGMPPDHPYASRVTAEGVFPFAPADHMGMKCWEPRRG